MSASVFIYYEGDSLGEFESLLKAAPQIDLKCSCGATHVSKSSSRSQANKFVKTWRANHSGKGHRILPK